MSRLPLPDLAASVLGSIVAVNWPHLREAKVVSVADSSMQFRVKVMSTVRGGPVTQTVIRRDHSQEEKVQFFTAVDGFKQQLLTGSGQLRQAGIKGEPL